MLAKHCVSTKNRRGLRKKISESHILPKKTNGHSSTLASINKPGTAQVGALSKAQQIVKFGEKIDNAIREMKTLYPNFETLYPN